MTRHFLASCIAAASLLAFPLASAQVAVSGPYWPGPAVSGSWYDPARSGEGLILQFLPNGKALLIWFTYPPAGEAAEQAWLITELGSVDGSKLRFNAVYRPQGGVFGDAFNPDSISSVLWGTMELEFRDCNMLTLRYAGPTAFGSGERTMTRLTSLDQLACNGTRALTITGARALEGLRTKSGAWYVPSRSGEGWMIEELPDGRSLVYWFTYDPQGRQAWTIGVGTREGNRLEIPDNLITRGTRFGSGFDPAQVQGIPWGSLSFNFTNCDSVDVSYASILPGYGSGTRAGTRLAALAGAACLDGTPGPRTQGNWVEAAAIPGPAQSEHAATVLDGKLYIMGGFGDPHGFKRYDPVTNSWAILPAMPAGRDHLAAFAIDGGVYFSGGAPQDGDFATAAFRYDIAANRWDPRPELSQSFGSHAAILNGRAYIGNLTGTLQEYDPNQRVARIISRALPPRPRDHSQVVAFLGEIWMIAGRSPETTTVAIYDPVAERWRNGPSIARGRGGFAAAVVGDQIVIGGGEFLGPPIRLEPSVEIYTAGSTSWQFGPDLPIPVHGVPGAALNGRFYAVSGSTAAGAADAGTGRMFSISLRP
jgi:hypothetical protein